MVESFIKYLQFEKRYSPKTVVSYTNDLTQFTHFITTEYPDFTIEGVSFDIVRSWIVQLSDNSLSPSSINRKIACLRSFYKFLMRQEVITKDPMTKIKVLKTRKKLPHFVKENDIVPLLDTSEMKADHDGWRIRLILELFYGTGMRLSELIGLKESAINFHDQTLKVLGKRNKERVIPFSGKLVSIIKEYVHVRNREIAAGEHGHLIVTDSGEVLYPMMVNRIVKKYLKTYTSVEKASPHVLRHTYATHLLNKGAEINAVKDLLGHTSLAATQVYTHNSMEKLKKVFEQAHPKA